MYGSDGPGDDFGVPKGLMKSASGVLGAPHKGFVKKIVSLPHRTGTHIPQLLRRESYHWSTIWYHFGVDWGWSMMFFSALPPLM